MTPYVLTASVAALTAFIPASSKAQPARLGADKPILLAQAGPPPLPQPAAAQVSYSENGKPVGPVTLAEIQAKISAGAITPDTLVWKSGAPNWVAAKELAEVAALFAAAKPAPAPAPTPAPSPAPVAAAGCTGKVLLADDFRQVDSSWGTDANSDSVSVEDGKVKIKADVNSGYTVLYGGLTFDDAQICVTAQVPRRLTDSAQLAAGPVFWAEDYSNFYTFNVAPDSTAAILRKVKGKYIPVIAYRKTEGIKTKPGDKNVLRIVTSGNNITAYINGVKFGTARGQAPSGGGQVGLRAESEKAQRDTWKFLDFKVTQGEQGS
jgi:GYF domain 2